MTSINRLSSDDALSQGDLVPVYSNGQGVTRKATAAAFVAAIGDSYVTQAQAQANAATATVAAFQSMVYPGVYAVNPTTRPNGTAMQDGDRAVILLGGVPTEYLRTGGTWIVPNVGAANLAASSGSSLVGFIQSGTGAVATTVQNKTRERYSVFDVLTDAERADVKTGTPLIDTSVKIQAAIDNALASGRQVVADGIFRVGAQKIVFKGNADFSMATFLVYGSPSIALEVSTGNASDPTTTLSNAVVVLPKLTQNMGKPTTGWAGQGIGVRTVNASSCEIHTGHIQDFAIGFQSSSFGTGNVYNTCFVGFLENNQVNCDLVPGNSTGWVNENVFIGGRWSFHSSEGTNVAGTRHIRLQRAANAVNNNVFVKPSIEGDTPEYHVENGGSYNTLSQARWETTTSPKVLYISDNVNQAGRNLILGGYQSQNIVFTYSGAGGKSNLLLSPGVEYANMNIPGRFQNESSSATPIHNFYEAGTLPETAGASDWSMSHGSQSLSGKRKADVAERLKLDYVNGRLYVGDGTATATKWLGGNGSAVSLNSTFLPNADSTFALGATSLKWTNLNLSGSVGFFGTAPIGSRPVVTGSKGANAALASLLTALASYGIITDSTT